MEDRFSFENLDIDFGTMTRLDGFVVKLTVQLYLLFVNHSKILYVLGTILYVLLFVNCVEC